MFVDGKDDPQNVRSHQFVDGKDDPQNVRNRQVRSISPHSFATLRNRQFCFATISLLFRVKIVVMNRFALNDPWVHNERILDA
jgi:hypothetical protein